MGELTYTVPVIGELVTAACPKVDTALSAIKTEVNGKIEATNIKNESVTVEKIAKSGKWVNEGALLVAALKKGEKVEKEPSATENALVLLSIATTAGTTNVLIKVGTVLITTIETNTALIVPVGAFRVPAGEKYIVESAAFSTGEVATTSEFAYMKGVV